ncbi:MAG TPA: hypothetical protein VJK06_09060 [Methyloceanibacter sp.]|jgi:hypothetical protein|nr:hypothetical protein [Methyloceanibacter sp.]
MTKFLVKSAFCAAAVLALGVTANAASPYSLPGTSVVIQVGDRDSYYRPDVNAYGPTILHDDDRYLYEPDTAGADEIRELQRAFPQTNWPSSMRYYERP